MSSLARIFNTLSAVVSVAEPHISKLIDYKKALVIAQAENKRLAAENKSLKTTALISGIAAIVFFIAFIITLVLLLS